MLIDALLVAGALLTGALTAYAGGHYLFVALFLAARASGRVFTEAPLDAVTVGVPARNEGDGAVRCVRSLLAQDHAGSIEIALLIRDHTDTAMPFLKAAFPSAHLDETSQVIELHRSANRRVLVCFTGSDPKHLKVNWLADRLTTPYVAILDCDHQAHVDWIRTSLVLMTEGGGRLIQARREPISARGVFGLWDSLHQHIGCEVVNVAYSRLGLSVFFTGTTAVMERELFRHNPLRDCLTEDTDLSYQLLLQGEKLLYNPYSGSEEEVSPDLYSFLARRRRWAHGHTETFLEHLRLLPRAPLKLRQRAQFLFHGAHYLLAVVVFVAHALIGLLFWLTLPTGAQVASLAAGAGLAWVLTSSQRMKGWWGTAALLGVIFTWLTPAVVLLMNLGLALSLGDLQRLVLPGTEFVLLLGLIGVVSPLVLLLVGMAGYHQLGLGSSVAVVLSYPLAFYLDISGVLIGLVDLLLGTRIWLAVARAPQPESKLEARTVSSGIRASWGSRSMLSAALNALLTKRWKLMKPSTWIPLALVAAIMVGGVVLTLPPSLLPVADRACSAMEWDGHPWIAKPTALTDFCGPAGTPNQPGARVGAFKPVRVDHFETLDPTYWDVLDDTFPCNEARFSPANVVASDGLALSIRDEVSGDRAFTAGSIATKTDPDAKHLYGRYEVDLQVPKGSGQLTAFFLYRFDPWQEIDTEFLGRDTSKLMINVFYNPGEEGDLYNYGHRGTPVLIDLGFDASEDFHRYAIEWDPTELRWFVDDQLVHARAAGRPTPIPQLPMRFHLNTWPICSIELAGPMDKAALPATATIRSVTVSSWYAPWGEPLEASAKQRDWRERARWMKSGEGRGAVR